MGGILDEGFKQIMDSGMVNDDERFKKASSTVGGEMETNKTAQGFRQGLLEKGMNDGLHATQQLSSEQERLHQIMQGMTMPQLINMIAPRLDAMNAIRQDAGMSNPFVQFMMRGQQ